MDGKGHCLCGAVQFEARNIETHVHACHCNMCRHWNGGPAMAVYVGSVEFTGVENITRYSSSDWADRGFCSRCGSNLFYLLKPDQYIIGTGLFDDQTFDLESEIYCESKPDWYNLSGDHPRHPALPDQ